MAKILQSIHLVDQSPYLIYYAAFPDAGQSEHENSKNRFHSLFIELLNHQQALKRHHSCKLCKLNIKVITS